MNDQQEIILNEFREFRSLYEDFTAKMKQLISSLINENKIEIFTTISRVKTIKSLDEKLTNPNKNYTHIDNVPDLSGIRIIVYHLDDVPKIAGIIRDEFDVDELESSDKSKNLEADKFGYLSLHLVISLSENRADLQEWAKFKSLHTELQISTMLQHTWTEISHFMQYKKENDVPKILQRRLYRIAALFELADQEFDELKKEHTALKELKDKDKILRILKNTPGTDLHSYDWIRDHTQLELSDEEFNKLVKNNQRLLIHKIVKARDENGERIIPGKPGLRFKRNDEK